MITVFFVALFVEGATVLGALGVTADAYENKMQEVLPRGAQTRLRPEDFTPRVKKVMELAVMQAASMHRLKPCSIPARVGFPPYI